MRPYPHQVVGVRCFAEALREAGIDPRELMEAFDAAACPRPPGGGYWFERLLRRPPEPSDGRSVRDEIELELVPSAAMSLDEAIRWFQTHNATLNADGPNVVSASVDAPGGYLETAAVDVPQAIARLKSKYDAQEGGQGAPEPEAEPEE